MKFRAGLMIGGAVGYVLGAKAGRPRYEQIKSLARRLRRHPAVAQLLEQATGVTDLARNTMAGRLDVGSRRLKDSARRASASWDQVETAPTQRP